MSRFFYPKGKYFMNLNYKCIKMTLEIITLKEPYLVIKSF
jgi:hypothetical protein